MSIKGRDGKGTSVKWKQLFGRVAERPVPADEAPPAPVPAEPVESERQRFFSLNALDEKLRRHINHQGGFYVELGANDGLNQSNTKHFEQELGWQGVLIEPIPHMFLRCLENRGAQNKVFCAACVPTTYTEPFVPMIYSNLMTVAPALDLDVGDPQAHAALGLQFLQGHERNFTFGAVARTLTSILDEAEAPRQIDLLSLDVEGGELDVLKGLDLNKYSFRHMIIEGRDVGRLKNHLEPRGYRLLDQLSEQDHLFVLERAPD